jgi:hypothetical protein
VPFNLSFYKVRRRNNASTGRFRQKRQTLPSIPIFDLQERHMPSSERGGSHEQHVKAGESHKNTSGSGSKDSGSEGSTRGGSHEQHVKAGQQSHKNS